VHSRRLAMGFRSGVAGDPLGTMARQRRSGTGRQVVVVTGASAGVGRATAVEFARRGARVALIARGHDGLAGAKRDVEAAGGEAIVLPADVADAEAVDAAADEAERSLGPIDVWVNNAMATVFARFLDIGPAEFRRASEVTYLGYVWGTRAALHRMRPRNSGTIVQVGSALAYRGIPLQSAYCAAKHAVEGFTESVRCELLHDGSDIRLTMVQLPALNTPQFGWSRAKLPNHPQPVPPIYQPEVAARAIVWAAGERRRDVWVGLPTALTIAGNRLAPALGDAYLARTAFDSQQTHEPLDGDRPDNLFEPVPGDRGAHGRFDADARQQDRWFQLVANRDRVLTGLGVGLVALALRRR
jgi:NAD(P)-dependent dehydrogenase (short-subunit alcohol dehydrogenase family)